MCISVCLRVCVPRICPVPEEGLDSPELELTEGCEQPCGGWEFNLGPLQKQQVLISAQPSLQPLVIFLRQSLDTYIPGWPELLQTRTAITDVH